MVNFTVVSDSAYDLPPELELMKVEKAEVSVIVDGGEKVFRSSELTYLDVLKLFEEGHSVTTAAPSAGEWLRVFERAREPVLAVAISSKLSSSFNNALLAARMSEKEVYVVDSLSVSIGQGLVVYHALLLSEEAEIEEARARLAQLAGRTRVYLSLGSMEFLARSGRVPWVVGKVGELLNFHPILEVSDGVIRRAGMVRGGVVDRIARYAERGEDPLIVGKVGSVPEADRLLLLLRQKGREVYETYTCPDITVHTGPGSFGLALLLR